MISFKDLCCPAGPELAAIECFFLYYAAPKHNIVAVFIFTDAEKKLEAGRLLPGILIEQIGDTGYLLLHNETGVILAKLIDGLSNKRDHAPQGGKKVGLAAAIRAVDHTNRQDIISLFSLYKAVLELRKSRSLEIECGFISIGAEVAE